MFNSSKIRLDHACCCLFISICSDRVDNNNFCHVCWILLYKITIATDYIERSSRICFTRKYSLQMFSGFISQPNVRCASECVCEFFPKPCAFTPCERERTRPSTPSTTNTTLALTTCSSATRPMAMHRALQEEEPRFERRTMNTSGRGTSRRW